MKPPVGDKLFQDIPRRLAKFRENRPRDVKKSVDGRKKDKCVSRLARCIPHYTALSNAAARNSQ